MKKIDTFDPAGYDVCTPTVGELIDFLTRFPRELPVIGTWEGIYAPINGVEFYQKHDPDGCDAVVIDADK